MKQTDFNARSFRWGALVLAGTLAACGGGDEHGDAKPLACEQLEGLSIRASAIDLPTSGARIDSATVVAASGTGAAAVPEHCLVAGHISPVDATAPDIRFNVALPSEWNRKALMLGGGGFNGSIPNVRGNVSNGPVDKPTPIGRGYATFASDSGHQANEFGSQDGSWGLNAEAVRNFGGDALKKTHDVAVSVIKAHYAKKSSKTYFAGGSTGGREALVAIQRWPDDWDGAIAWYPAWNDAAALLGGHRTNIALAQPGAYPNTPKRLLVYQAAMEACDGLDGVQDGLISQQKLCNTRFDPATATVGGQPLRCAGGMDAGDSCLSDAQIQALNVMNTDTVFNFPLASGETRYPGYNVWGADLGITSNPSPLQPVVTFLALGTSQPAMPMPRSAPYISVLVDQWIKYSITGDPAFNSLLLDPENPGVWGERISDLSKQLDTSTDISAFAKRGGKLLLAHGLADVLVSSRATELYYERLVAQMGEKRVRKFVRYYEVPGLGHAVSTVFNATWDSLTALENWAEKNKAPENQVTVDTVGIPGRSRPLCDYPEWPRYFGSGDAQVAKSFVCTK